MVSSADIVEAALRGVPVIADGRVVGTCEWVEFEKKTGAHDNQKVFIRKCDDPLLMYFHRWNESIQTTYEHDPMGYPISDLERPSIYLRQKGKWYELVNCLENSSDYQQEDRDGEILCDRIEETTLEAVIDGDPT